MVDMLLLLGVAGVLPLAFGRRWGWWWAAAAAVGVALRLPTGAGAAVLVAPWLILALVESGSRVAGLVARRRAGTAATAATAAVAVANRRTGDASTGRDRPKCHRLARGAGLTGPARVLLAVSGLAVWAPVVLAVAWAAGEHWDVPFLSIPDMARTHGVANAVGFVVAGLVGGRLASPAGLFPGRMSDPALAARHRAAVAGEVTYPDPGRTLAEGGPMVVSRPIGHGPDAFAAAVQALRDWAPQHSIGARVYPADAPLEVGTTVLVVLRAGPLEVVAPDRIVAFVDEPGRFGYAYGTLPGHPERGEESFVVRLEPSGTVTATVTVDARPGLWPMAAVGPAVRVLQRAAARRYVATLHRAVTTAGTAGTAARSSR